MSYSKEDHGFIIGPPMTRRCSPAKRKRTRRQQPSNMKLHRLLYLGMIMEILFLSHSQAQQAGIPSISTSPRSTFDVGGADPICWTAPASTPVQSLNENGTASSSSILALRESSLKLITAQKVYRLGPRSMRYHVQPQRHWKSWWRIQTILPPATTEAAGRIGACIPHKMI